MSALKVFPIAALLFCLVACAPKTATTGTPNAPNPPALQLANDLALFTDSLGAAQSALETAKANGAITPANMATITSKFIVPGATLVKQIDAILRAQPDWPTARKQIISAVAAAAIANVSANVPQSAQVAIAAAAAAYNAIAARLGVQTI